MSRRLALVAATVAGALTAVSPADARAIPAAVTHAAAASVVSAQSEDATTTGFAFRTAQRVLVASPGPGRTRITAANGQNVELTVPATDGGLASVDASALGLATFARTGTARAGSTVYVLGGPLGYAGDPIRAVRLRFSGAAHHGTRAVRGTLPKRLRGAPVVTAGGTLVGAVSRTRPNGWTLSSVAQLERDAEAATKPATDGGIATIVLVGGLLLIALVVALAAALITRRRRRAPAPSVDQPRPVDWNPLARGRRRPPPPGASMPADEPPGAAQVPLVQRREAPAATAPDEDFEIVFKSHEDDR